MKDEPKYPPHCESCQFLCNYHETSQTMYWCDGTIRTSNRNSTNEDALTWRSGYECRCMKCTTAWATAAQKGYLCKTEADGRTYKEEPE